MKLTKLAAAAALALGLSAATVIAAPASLAPMTAGTAQSIESQVVQIHQGHRHCERGRAGWHRHSPRRGRVVCNPRPHGPGWAWHCAVRNGKAHCGWWHGTGRRWH